MSWAVGPTSLVAAVSHGKMAGWYQVRWNEKTWYVPVFELTDECQGDECWCKADQKPKEES